MTGRTPATSFRDLLVWQKAHQLVLKLYEYSAKFPRVEVYGLTSQLRRAAVSVPANISEGFRRRGKPDKARMLNIAQGSLEECRYYRILAQDLSYGQSENLMNDLDEVSRMLDVYVKAVASGVSYSSSVF
jgi:four helix bundle protein